MLLSEEVDSHPGEVWDTEAQGSGVMWSCANAKGETRTECASLTGVLEFISSLSCINEAISSRSKGLKVKEVRKSLILFNEY